MSETRLVFIAVYIVAVILAYLLKRVINHTAKKAIKEQKLSTGIYSLFPVEGKKAIELANGYIRGIKIVFWFVILFFPLLFILALIQGVI